jgi:hypothetical protein
MYCRSLAAVQHAAVDGAAVGCPGHEAVENVQLADKMTLADATDRRIAAHLAKVVSSHGDKRHVSTRTSRCTRSFAASVTRTYDKDVEHLAAISISVPRGTSLAETETSK